MTERDPRQLRRAPLHSLVSPEKAHDSVTASIPHVSGKFKTSAVAYHLNMFFPMFINTHIGSVVMMDGLLLVNTECNDGWMFLTEQW